MGARLDLKPNGSSSGKSNGQVLGKGAGIRDVFRDFRVTFNDVIVTVQTVVLIYLICTLSNAVAKVAVAIVLVIATTIGGDRQGITTKLKVLGINFSIKTK